MLTARRADAAGNITTSAAVTVTVSNAGRQPSDTTAPSVAVSAPADGSTVSGEITITADSLDNIAVASVQFMLDGANLGADDTTAPYSVSWDTTSAGNGTHALTARARDAAGNMTTSPRPSASRCRTPSRRRQRRPARSCCVPPTCRRRTSSATGSGRSQSTAADWVALWNTDNGVAKIAPALVAPQHYVDITFNAEAGKAYHLWIRMRAQNDYYGNDSIHVQFSDAVDASGSPIYRIGSSGADNSAQVVLQETDNGPISGWGWADQGWNGLGSHIYFAASGPHTLRIQQREDGVMFDQIVLSPDTFLTAPPGQQNRDNTIVPK